MIKKNMFLRGFCMAAALALAAGNMPSAALQSYAAVSETGEEAAAETEDQTAEPEDQAAEAEVQAEAAETETEGQAEETETETEGQAEETEAETEGQTEETEAETEGQAEETEAETEGQAEETEAETEGQGTEDGTEAEDQDTSEEKPGETAETGTEGQSAETEEEGTKADSSEGSDSDIDEEKAENAAPEEEEIPAEGLVEKTEAETLPAAEAELKPELLEASSTLSSVDITVDWNLTGQTVSSARSKVAIKVTNNNQEVNYQDVFKKCDIVFSESQTGAALADSTVLQAGKTYYVRFNVSLKSGYYVNSTTSFTLNDSPISMTFSGAATSFNLYGYNTLQNAALSEVTVKFTWPEDGDTVAEAKKTISITNQDKFETCNIYFRKAGQSGQMADTDVFQGSVNYELYFNIKLKSGYAVDSKTKITKNGANVDLGIPEGQQWNSFSFSHGATVVKPDLTSLKELVTRFYRGCMGREPDAGGLNYWAQQLHKKKSTGAYMLEYFFNSTEFQNQGVSDEEYIDRLYRVIFNRSADGSGKKYWLEILGNGVSRTYLLYQFGASGEFKTLCSNYGITQGKVKIKEDRDRNYGITSFLARIYLKALERSYDISGLNYWAGQILNASSKTAQIISAAQAFFLSNEMQGQSLSNEQMLMRMYRVFLNREADFSGLTYWLDQLAGGMTMKQVIASFAHSNEFKQLMEQYGIK